MLIRRSPQAERRGSVAVEMAVLLPLLMFLAVVGVDYARIFSRAIVIESASRNACYWGAQHPDKSIDPVGIKAVAMRDLTEFTSAGVTPTVTTQLYTGSDGFQHLKVTVTVVFNTVTKYPGVPSSTNLSRTTDMRVCPKTPKPGTF
jgi:Flp pilus assembly protein TadG